MFLNWYISATASSGLSRGLVGSWDPTWVSVEAFQCFAGILLEASFHGIPGHVHILNVYAPYKDSLIFWGLLFSFRIMELVSVIIESALNYTISRDEVWGHCKKIDPLARLIQYVILMHNFVDICLTKIAPTWDNGRSRMAYVSKRVDHFLIHEQLLE